MVFVEIVEPSAVKLTICRDSPLLTIWGLMVALSNVPFSEIVPSPGLLVTSPLYFWLASRDSAYRRRLMTGKLAGSL